MHRDLRVYDIERMWMVEGALRRAQALAPIRTILDCACNTGFWLAQAARFCPDARLTGVDRDASSVAAARSRVPKAEFHHIDCREHLDANPNSYDFIFCMGLLYYFHDFEGLLERIAASARIGVLVDTVVLRDPDSRSRRRERVGEFVNAANCMTHAAGGAQPTVRIPNQAALERSLWRLGLHTCRVDSYSGEYEESVANRLGADLDCIGLLAVQRECPFTDDRSWSGWATTTIEGQRVCTAYAGSQPRSPSARELVRVQ